jgi:hypothetical protein
VFLYPRKSQHSSTRPQFEQRENWNWIPLRGWELFLSSLSSDWIWHSTNSQCNACWSPFHVDRASGSKLLPPSTTIVAQEVLELTSAWRFRLGLGRNDKLCTFFNIWGFHGDDDEECRLLGYKTAVHTSQETRYVSATESSQLMLCKIWSLHGSDYEVCRVPGDKNTVRTSQDTHNVSATELS